MGWREPLPTGRLRRHVWAAAFIVCMAHAAGGAAVAATATASPSSCQNVPGIGSSAWSNPDRAMASDDRFAAASVDGTTTNWLVCSDYGFTIPSGATIDGITVSVERKSSSTANGGSRDAAVRVVKGGVIGSADRASATIYTTSDVVEAHGGAADLWATTWTPADINAVTFGAAFAATKPSAAGGAHTVSVDHIQITVHYTLPCTPPPNAPPGISLSCVCDTFGRTSLNPSPIFGANWIVSTSDSTGVLPGIVNPGYLRLTNNTTNNAKAATLPGIFPAAGNYISVEFQHYAYNGSGADGIAVTLSDYSVPAVPGAYGGSLGYAQRTGVVGFAGGWIGVALDEYGNYQNPTEGRLGGPGFIVQSVGVRGSGSGMNGYRWLGGTSSLSPGIDNRASTSPSPGYSYQVIVDARNEPVSTAVQVNRDTGSGYQSLVDIPNVYAAASAQGFTQAPVPAAWQISFTGSTGASTNIHEIGALRVCAQTVYPPSGGTASGFNAIDEAYGNPPSVSVQNYLTGHIYMKLMGVPFKLNVAALANNQIQTAYVVSGSKSVTVKLVDNSDNACVLDNSQPNYCSAACRAKPAVPGGSQTLTFVPSDSGQKQSANFTLNSAYRKLAAIISDGTVTACSTDAFSVRPTRISAVISADATNGGTSGMPVFKAAADAFSLTATVSGVAGNANGYAGVLKIDNAAVQPVAPAMVAGSIAPATFGAATSGTPDATATGSTFTYSEVGAFRLRGYDPASDTTSLRGVYDGVHSGTECSGLTQAQCDTVRAATWTGVDSVSTMNDCVADSYSNTSVNGKYGCNFGLVATTAAFGRFIPNEFRVSNVALVNRQAAAAACGVPSVFSYLDEGIGLQFKLSAHNGTGAVTRNYAGSLAKLMLDTSGSSLAFGAANTVPFTALSSRIWASNFSPVSWPAMGAADAGEVSLSGTVTVSSLNGPGSNRVTPDGPFANATIGIAPVDSDGVRILTYDLDTDNAGGADHKALAATKLYFGQLRLLPALGSERLPLAMPAEILRWTGTGFAPNGDDSCTSVPFARLALRDWAKNLNPGETSIISGNLSFTAGKATLRLSAPGAGNDGMVNVTADLGAAAMGYLAGRWQELPGVADVTPNLWDDNPWAPATFGLYKGAAQIIHFRENF
jgi:MSHA biogenesis protein MshQ